MACGLAAWAVGAVLAGEPDAQSDMATTALGGRGARAGLEVMLVLAVAAVLTVVFVAYPLVFVALGVGNEFRPPCGRATSSPPSSGISAAAAWAAPSACCSPRRG